MVTCVATLTSRIGTIDGGVRYMNGKGEEERRYDDRLTLVLRNLQLIAEDRLVPRNIRRVVQDSIAMLRNGELSIAVRAANVVSMLEEVTLDYNIPTSARVTFWSVISKLEDIRE